MTEFHTLSAEHYDVYTGGEGETEVSFALIEDVSVEIVNSGRVVSVETTGYDAATF